MLLAAGCGGGGKKSATTTTTASGALKIGMVTDVGGLNDRGFNHLAYVGLKQAQAQLGVQIQVAESKSPADYVPNLASFARRGFDLVIGVGYTEIAAMGAAAKRFPDTHFAIVDVSNKDLAGTTRRTCSACSSARSRSATSPATWPGSRPSACRAPTSSAPSPARSSRRSTGSSPGYQAGAKKADPGIKTLNAYSQDFVDQAKCKELALNQIAAGLRRRLPGRRRLRARRARRGQGEERLGDRRRRRPVVPRAAHPDERDEARRPRGLPRNRVRARRDVQGRRRRVRPEGGRRRPRQDQPEGAEERGRRGREDQAADRRRARSRTSPPCP